MPDAGDEVHESIAEAHRRATAALESEQAKDSPDAGKVARAKKSADLLSEAMGAWRN